MSFPSYHKNCISGNYFNTNIERIKHPREWFMADESNYSPPFYEIPELYIEPLKECMDPPKPQHIDFNNRLKRTNFNNFKFDRAGFPLNPCGPTGICGRGTLYKWGPNCAADPLVTRWKRDSNNNIIFIDNQPVLQFIAIRRKDTGEIALPGGMVEPNESVSMAAKREFSEEALNCLEMSDIERHELSIKIENFFKESHCVYEGYVDDHRNTDNAWIVTKCFLWHDNEGDIMNNFKLHAGDDAGDVMWCDYYLTCNLELYANHLDFIQQAYLYLFNKYKEY